MRKRLSELSVRGRLLGGLGVGALAILLISIVISGQLGPTGEAVLDASLRDVVLLAGTVILLGGLVATLIVSGSISSRVRALSREARAVAGGDLDRGVPASAGGDEIESLARSFNAMTESLRRARSDEAERSVRLVALHRASTAVAAQTERADALDTILSEAATLVGAGGASLFLWDPVDAVMRRVRNCGRGDMAMPAVVRPGAGMAGIAFERRAAFIVNDYDRWPHAAPGAVASGQRAGLAVPLLRAAGPVGAITLRSYDGKAFGRDDATLLELFADQMVASLAVVDAFDRQRSARDDAERQRVESERLAEELRSLLESMTEGVLGLDKDGHCTFINPAAQEMLGYSLEDMHGISAHAAVHHHDAVGASDPTRQCPFYQSRITGQAISGDDEVLWRRDGSWFPARCAVAPVVWHGRPTGAVIVTFSDISPRKLAERQVTAAAEVERAAHEALVRLDKVKSDFVSIVTHQLRTPLTGIQGFSELIRDEDLSIAEVKDYANSINSDARRLGRMIKEILDLDRMAAGRMTLDLETLDLNQLIESVARNIRPTGRGHPLLLRLDGEVPPIVADRDLLSEALRNLVDNAAKYSPKGGEIVITTHRDGDRVHVVVRDHGIGIAPGSLEMIFDRYARVESEATRYVDGTGLGLPIVRQVVEMHGGRVWAESAVGEGSAFHFTVPGVAVPITVQG